VCAAFVGSLTRFGIPDEILTDNGKVFTGRFGHQPVELGYPESHGSTTPDS
jgi:hypothetical protein